MASVRHLHRLAVDRTEPHPRAHRHAGSDRTPTATPAQTPLRPPACPDAGRDLDFNMYNAGGMRYQNPTDGLHAAAARSCSTCTAWTDYTPAPGKATPTKPHGWKVDVSYTRMEGCSPTSASTDHAADLAGADATAGATPLTLRLGQHQGERLPGPEYKSFSALRPAATRDGPGHVSESPSASWP